ncbi:putative integral membrane protein linked to a cation pump [Aminobacter sp. MSH1]|uniref:FixH family protein n=1 Tax=Aminobacter sp. MSH1 TaxID=374606 RepID=UPI000D3D2DE9|nr:FixH family protein [Aminobacter sp. MSH1]AWC21491.1 putative integral membrane protein linked to a cation pump [Aminobacter sp. MSH1]
MNSRAGQPRQFTGWHMLAIMVAFFGVIIAVNLLMATFANTSWTGLVVQNTYVASQQFNERVAASRAQAALGWKGTLTIVDGEIRYNLVDASGTPVRAENVTTSFRRPAYEAEDWKVTLARKADGTFSAKAAVRDGIWIVNTEAMTTVGAPYQEARRIVVANGAVK